MSSTIKSWPRQDRPREKLLHKGIDSLSDTELLAIIIGSGTQKMNALELSKHIIKDSGDISQVGRLTLEQLMSFKGIGKAKAVNIAAAIEIGRRRQLISEASYPRIKSSKDAFDILGPLLADLSHEEFWIACLNRANTILCKEKISSGGFHGTVVDPKVIYSRALNKKASSIILYHNHPSGNLHPSKEDLIITKKLKEAGKILDIDVLDHLIIGRTTYYSFMDEGIL